MFRNPTQAQIEGALTGRKYMRVLHERSSGDILAWPGDEGLHADIMTELNLTEDTADNLGKIRSFEEYQKLVNWVGGRS